MEQIRDDITGLCILLIIHAKATVLRGQPTQWPADSSREHWQQVYPWNCERK